MSGARLQVRVSDADAARELLNTVPAGGLESSETTVGENTPVCAALADNGDDL
jgi:hypothetical protein